MLKTRCTPWWTLVYLKIQSLLAYESSTNKLFFVSKQIWQQRRSICNLPVHNFYLNHEVLLKNPFSRLSALCFPSGDVFLLVHPTSLLLLTFCQTRGFFCSEKYFLCFHVPKLIGINCFWPQINFSPFFSANYPWSQIIVHKFEEVPFSDSSASVLFNILRKFCNQDFIKNVVVALLHVLPKCQSTLLAPIEIVHNASNERGQIFPTPSRVWCFHFFGSHGPLWLIHLYMLKVKFDFGLILI